MGMARDIGQTKAVVVAQVSPVTRVDQESWVGGPIVFHELLVDAVLYQTANPPSPLSSSPLEVDWAQPVEVAIFGSDGFPPEGLGEPVVVFLGITKRPGSADYGFADPYLTPWFYALEGASGGLEFESWNPARYRATLSALNLAIDPAGGAVREFSSEVNLLVDWVREENEGAATARGSILDILASDDYDRLRSELIAFGQPIPPWRDQPPEVRPLNDADTPSDVLGNLRHVVVLVVVPAEAVDAAAGLDPETTKIVTRTPYGVLSVARVTAGTHTVDAYVREGDEIEVLLSASAVAWVGPFVERRGPIVARIPNSIVDEAEYLVVDVDPGAVAAAIEDPEAAIVAAATEGRGVNAGEFSDLLHSS